MEAWTQEMSLQELIEAWRWTDQENYGGSSDFGFNINLERIFYERKLSELLRWQHPELNDKVVWVRLEIEQIIKGILNKNPEIMREYVEPAVAA